MVAPFHLAIRIDTFHEALDLGGTFVFALSGGMAGVKHRLDIFGVLVLSFAAANSGGIARDVMIGATPVAALSDWRYVAVSLLAGILTFYCYPFINRLSGSVLYSMQRVWRFSPLRARRRLLPITLAQSRRRCSAC